MITAALVPVSATDGLEPVQPCLFTALPRTGPERRRPRRAAARSPVGIPGTAGDAAITPADVPEPTASPPASALPPAPTPAAGTVSLAELTNPELADLIDALPDLRLGFLLTRAAREVKRRLEPIDWDEGEPAPPPAPNPALLRAARAAVVELADSETADQL